MTSFEVFSRANPYRGTVRAVVLDWSGTAVDFGFFGTILPIMEAFRENWIEVERGEARKHAGLAVWDVIAAMLDDPPVRERWTDIYGVPPSDFEIGKIFAAVERFSVDTAALYAEPVPGLLDAVSALRGRGIRIGSTSELGFQAMEVLSETARQFGYAPDSVVCAAEVPAGRPLPWMCWQNAINLEVHPLESIVKVGGTAFGIQEGLNAGMWTVGVTSSSGDLGLTIEEFEGAGEAELRGRLDFIAKGFFDAGAHFVVEAIRDLPHIVSEIDRKLAAGERP